MKRIASLGLTACALALLGLAVKQRQQLAARAVGHREIGSPIAAPASSLTTSNVRVASDADTLTEAEHLELLQLRGQIRPLTDRLAGMTAISNRNVRLHAKLTSTQAASAFPPPGYIRRTEAQNRGTQTPEATLETFLWAGENRDTNTFLSVFGESIRSSMMGDLTQRGVEGFFKSQVPVPGARIVSRRDITDSEAELTVEFGPGAGFPMRFRRENGGWVMEP